MNILNLAEICGIHAGDGYLRNDGKRRELDISGNIEEKEFYNEHIIPLFKRTLNVCAEGRYFPSRNTYGFVSRQLEVIEFLHKIGFPYGKKSDKVEIPKFILKSKDLKLSKRFIRGLFDTDGCFCPDKKNGSKYHTYPRIFLSTISQKLFEQLCLSIDKIGIKYYTRISHSGRTNERIRYTVWVTGSNVISWMKFIGSKNPIHVSKYRVWSKFGFCPPRTTLEQRKQILNKRLDPRIFYGPLA